MASQGYRLTGQIPTERTECPAGVTARPAPYTIHPSTFTLRSRAYCERMQCGDETDTDSNAYLVIELQLVKVSQDGHISRIVHVLLRDTLDILAAPKPKIQMILVTLLWLSRHCS